MEMRADTPVNNRKGSPTGMTRLLSVAATDRGTSEAASKVAVIP